MTFYSGRQISYKEAQNKYTTTRKPESPNENYRQARKQALAERVQETAEALKKLRTKQTIMDVVKKYELTETHAKKALRLAGMVPTAEEQPKEHRKGRGRLYRNFTQP